MEYTKQELYELVKKFIKETKDAELLRRMLLDTLENATNIDQLVEDIKCFHID